MSSPDDRLARIAHTLETLALLAQALFYTAGVVALIHLMLLGSRSNARMEQEHARMEQEHARIMLQSEQTLREGVRR